MNHCAFDSVLHNGTPHHHSSFCTLELLLHRYANHGSVIKMFKRLPTLALQNCFTQEQWGEDSLIASSYRSNNGL